MAHPDLDALFDTLLSFTQKMLSEHGGFNPWGAFMSPNGEIQWVGAHDGAEFPEAQSLIDMLTETFQRESKRGVLRAVGICYDVRVLRPGQSEKSDAVCCSLEHVSGEAVDVFVPYAKAANGIHYSESLALLRDPRFLLPTAQWR